MNSIRFCQFWAFGNILCVNSLSSTFKGISIEPHVRARERVSQQLLSPIGKLLGEKLFASSQTFLILWQCSHEGLGLFNIIFYSSTISPPPTLEFIQVTQFPLCLFAFRINKSERCRITIRQLVTKYSLTFIKRAVMIDKYHFSFNRNCTFWYVHTYITIKFNFSHPVRATINAQYRRY